MRHHLPLALLLIAGLLCFNPIARCADIAPGSSIEVREGDTWSKVTVVAVEGHKVQVRYDDGTQEWVGPDRLRPPGAAVPQPPAPNVGTIPTPQAVVRAFTVNEAVEGKHDNKWNPGHVRDISQHWFLVADDTGDKMRWVEPWTLRVVGSSYDIESGGTGNWPAAAGQVAPHDPPGKSPFSLGDQFVVTPEDQRLPTAEDLDTKYDKASFDSSHEPVTGAKVTLNIATTRPGSEMAAWALHGPEERLGSVLPCGNSVKTAVAVYPGSFGKWTSIVRANLLAHGQLDARSLHIPDLKVVSAANEGDLLLSTYSWDKNLQLWQWATPNYKLILNLRVDPNEGSHITAATLIGTDKAVVSESDGEVYLVDLPNKRIISSIKGAPDAHVYVHPSEQIVGVITSSGTAVLLNSADFAVIAEYSDAGSAANISVDPSGQWAAYLTNTGAVKIVKISDGTQLGTISVGSAFKGRIDLVDDKFILVDHTTVYDVKSGIPLWIYKMPGDICVAPLASGQFVLAAPDNRLTAAAAATIPDEVGRAALKNARPDRFLLVPATHIKIDGDYNAFGDDHQKAQDTIEGSLRSAGMVLSDKDEPFHLTLGLAAGPTEKRDYAEGMFAMMPGRPVTSVQVPSNIFTAILMYKGQAVWSQEIRFMAGGMLQKDATHSYQDSANAAAKPNVQSLKSLNFPSFLPVGAKPGTPAALGVSDLQDRRFVPEKPAAPAPPAH